MPHHISNFLKQELEVRKLKNKRYSLRKFAYDIKISPTALSRIFNQKIEITPKTLTAIEKKIKIPEHLFQNKTDILQKKHWREKKIRHISVKETEIFKSWKFAAVWEIITLDTFNQDITWIAKRLSTPKKDILQCLDLLLEYNLISFVNNRWTTNFTEASTLGIASTSQDLINLQVDFLKYSIQSLKNDPVESRDHSAMIIAMDEDLLNDAKLKIKKFRRSLATYLEKKSTGKKNKVYQLTIGFSSLMK